MTEMISTVLLGLLGGVAVVSAIRVFRCDSMVRAAYWLLVSFVSVGFCLIVLGAQFLGLVLILMMAGEMTIMAVFMVMFMMNPAGLNPMNMVHQHRTSVVSGAVSFLALTAVAFAAFPERPATEPRPPTEALGDELLEDSMLVFQMAGVTLLATMIGSIAIAGRQGRFGDAYDPSLPPPLELPVPAEPEADAERNAQPAAASDGAGGVAAGPRNQGMDGGKSAPAGSAGGSS